jgi:hypothetical protein
VNRFDPFPFASVRDVYPATVVSPAILVPDGFETNGHRLAITFPEKHVLAAGRVSSAHERCAAAK